MMPAAEYDTLCREVLNVWLQLEAIPLFAANPLVKRWGYVLSPRLLITAGHGRINSTTSEFTACTSGPGILNGPIAPQDIPRFELVARVAVERPGTSSRDRPSHLTSTVPFGRACRMWMEPQVRPSEPFFGRPRWSRFPS